MAPRRGNVRGRGRKPDCEVHDVREHTRRFAACAVLAVLVGCTPAAATDRAPSLDWTKGEISADADGRLHGRVLRAAVRRLGYYGIDYASAVMHYHERGATWTARR